MQSFRIFGKNVLKIYRDEELIELIAYQKLFWSYFGSKKVRFSSHFQKNWSDSQSDFEKF